MNFLKILRTTNFDNKVFGNGSLIQGETYYTYTQFAEDSASKGIGEIVFKEPSFNIINHPPLDDFIRDNKRILLFFPGGFGDAVMAGMVLPYVEDRLNTNIDICCSREKWLDIFRPMGMKGAWIGYPPTLETLDMYDGVITDITAFFPEKTIKNSPIIQICSSFGISPDESPAPEYKIENISSFFFKNSNSSVPKLGINFDSNGKVKSYPPNLQEKLVYKLKQLGFEIYIIGRKSSEDTSIPPELALDIRNKTSIKELVALISRLDAVIAVDSFIGHLSNIMKIPTKVLLSTTSSGFFSFHSNIECLSSKIECSPCFSVFDECPKGYPYCRAFYDESINPDVIAASIAKYMAESFKDRIRYEH